MKDVLFLIMEYCSGLRDKILTNTFTATEAIEWIQTFFSLD
jgi:hypothetical protein